MGIVKAVVVAASRIYAGIRGCRLGLGRRFETGESRSRLRDEERTRRCYGQWRLKMHCG